MSSRAPGVPGGHGRQPFSGMCTAHPAERAAGRRPRPLAHPGLDQRVVTDALADQPLPVADRAALDITAVAAGLADLRGEVGAVPPDPASRSFAALRPLRFCLRSGLG